MYQRQAIGNVGQMTFHEDVVMAFVASWRSENVDHTAFQTMDVQDVDLRGVRTVIGDLTDVEGQVVVG